jgi:type IV secretory pathway TraG/TraD family ATPase VirD4
MSRAPAEVNSRYTWWVGVFKALPDVALGLAFVAIGTALGLTILFFSQLGGRLAALALVPIAGGLHMIAEALPAFADPYSTVSGTAALGRLKDLKRAKLVIKKRRAPQLCLGRFKTWRGSYPVGYFEDQHAVSFGQTRSGKGMRLLVPNIKKLKRSKVIIDPKGELAAICGQYLIDKYGAENVLFINPFGELVNELWTTGRHKGKPRWPHLEHLKSCGFDPLCDPDFYPAHAEFFSKACELAESLIKLEHAQVTQHWALSARELVTAVIIYAKITETPAAPATMSDIVRLLSLPYSDNNKKVLTLKRIAQALKDYKIPPAIAATMKHPEHAEQEIADLGGSFLSNTKEVQDVIATVRGNITCLKDKTIRADMNKHPTIGGERFHFDMLKDRIIHVFIILPDKKLEPYAVWLRLIIANALNALMARGQGNIIPLVLVDEAGNLGHLQPLKAAMSMAAGKGARIWTFWQYIGQLRAAYGENEYQAFMQGAGVVTSFRAIDDTAEYLSRRMGDQTSPMETYTQDNVTKVVTKSKTGGGYPLMHPSQFAELKPGWMVGWFGPAAKPFLVYAPGYWEDCGAGLQKNPYYKKEAA